MTYTRCRIDTINSPDDGHIAAPNMYRIEINIHEQEMFFKLVIYKDLNEMHGQQNIKYLLSYLYLSKSKFIHYLLSAANCFEVQIMCQSTQLSK